MIKYFKITDILNAVNSFSKIERKKNETLKAKKDDFSHNNQAKSEKSEILVLDQMIE